MHPSNCDTSCFSTHGPSSFSPYWPSSNNWSNNWNTPSYPTTWANNWNTPSFAGNNFPSTFEGHFPSTFCSFPWGNNTFNRSFEGSFPSTFNGRFEGSFPWSNTFGSFPNTWANNWNTPSFPSTFGGNNWAEKSWTRHALPTEYRDVPARPMSVIEYQSLQNPIFVHPIDGSRMLHLCFDVKGFKPEEINVSLNAKERAVVVEAKHDSKDKEHHVTRSFTRKFILPEHFCCDLTKCEIKCNVTADGLLVVESLLPRLTAEELKTLKEKTPSTFNKTSPFVGGHNLVHGPTVSIPVKTVA
jgi:HSP20 family molecular chaperone IbpA